MGELADAIKMIAERHPGVAGTTIRAIHVDHEVPSVHAIVISQRSVEADGFVGPSWEDLATGEVASPEERIRTNPGLVGNPEQPAKLRSRIHKKPCCVHKVDPLTSAPFSSMPIDRISRMDSQSFKLLFLQRLRQPPLFVHAG